MLDDNDDGKLTQKKATKKVGISSLEDLILHKQQREFPS
jgi:hypothetical protein